MSVKLELFGLDELRQTLRQLPSEMMPEVAAIVEEHARVAAEEIKQGYPVRTTNLHPTTRRKKTWFPPGNLRARVQVGIDRQGLYTRARVKSTAPHSHLYDRDKPTAVRRNKRGANRGQMPAAPLANRMIPKAIRWRARMRKALIDLVTREGFEVSIE